MSSLGPTFKTIAGRETHEIGRVGYDIPRIYVVARDSRLLSLIIPHMLIAGAVQPDKSLGN